MMPRVSNRKILTAFLIMIAAISLAMLLGPRSRVRPSRAAPSATAPAPSAAPATAAVSVPSAAPATAPTEGAPAAPAPPPPSATSAPSVGPMPAVGAPILIGERFNPARFSVEPMPAAGAPMASVPSAPPPASPVPLVSVPLPAAPVPAAPPQPDPGIAAALAKLEEIAQKLGMTEGKIQIMLEQWSTCLEVERDSGRSLALMTSNLEQVLRGLDVSKHEVTELRAEMKVLLEEVRRSYAMIAAPAPPSVPIPPVPTPAAVPVVTPPPSAPAPAVPVRATRPPREVLFWGMWMPEPEKKALEVSITPILKRLKSAREELRRAAREDELDGDDYRVAMTDFREGIRPDLETAGCTDVQIEKIFASVAPVR